MIQEKTSVGCIGKEFFYAYSNLPKYVQKKTRDFIDKFSENPMRPGLNYEKIQVCDERLRSVRIDKEYRAILLVLPDDKYLLLYVAKHDDAYEWAQKRWFDYNENDNYIHIYMDVRCEWVEENTGKTDSGMQKDSIFIGLSKEDWENLQITEPFVELALQIYSEEQFYKMRECFPEEIFERLEFWLVGFSIDEIKAEIMEVPEEEAQGNIIVIEEHKSEMEQMWDSPLELWRIFLHPSQKKIAKMNASGPVSISGNPGTGKTVLAMHRSIWLAENVCKKPNEKILLTTFSKNLAISMKKTIISMSDSDIYSKIHVCHIDQWVSEYLKEKKYAYKIVYEDVLKEIWNETFRRCKNVLRFSERFYVEEWNHIIVPNEIKSLENYIKVSRVGRGTKLSREQKKELWMVFRCVYDIMESKKVRSFEMAVLDAEKIVLKQQDYRYRSIVVDEGQDLSNGVYKLLRALAGKEKSNDMFICSDVRQQIYNRKPMLSKCGINVKGRSRKLKISYRISFANKIWSEALLKGQKYGSIDDADTEKDTSVSKKQGNIPQVITFVTGKEEQQFVLQKIKELLEKGESPSSICVAGRLNSIARSCATYLAQNSVPVWMINTDDSNAQGAVHISTMHKVKGLEYDYLFIICANKDIVPLKVALDTAADEVEKREIILRERNLLYVASTRARKQLYITSVGEKSEFL